nr:immunoglobulin heavy chain junction region [Macaca mulatta]MOX58801.1 immunoglobulin heavy chain junction region [Macaca mulatta]MOX59690.1 immunoglobulin heavy chain junction region [Macaca mulatta]MOX61869.1 immunoglobulin heavy chain junction region [Macaca mulatta]MOX66976.1 immunoglobulin heavy chain junction region [Macaca mulatta]
CARDRLGGGWFDYW